MGLTISVAGILSITLNKKTSVLIDKKAYILEMLGGVMIIVLGFILWSSANYQ